MNYQDWPTKNPWTVKSKATGVSDLGVDDTLSFVLIGSNQIKVSGVGCGHTSTHSGSKWQEVCQPLAGNPEIVQGATIRIESEAVGKKTKLTCTVLPPPAPFTESDAVPGGGACWTAEDG